MKTLFKSVIVSIALIASISTYAQDRILEMPEFSKILVTDKFNVNLIQSDKHEIQVPEELSDNNFTVSNGKLVIKNADKKNNIPAITIYFVDLKSLETQGASSATSQGIINADKLEIDASGASNIRLEIAANYVESDISGASKVKLSGSATQHEIECSGASVLDAKGLQTEQTDLDVSGASKVEVFSKIIVGEGSGSASIKTNDDAVFQRFETTGAARVNSQKITVQNNLEDDLDEMMEDLEESLDELERSLENIDTNKGNKSTSVKIYSDGDVKVKKNSYRRRYSAHWSGIDLGFNLYGQDFFANTLPTGYENMELSFNNSFVFNWNITDYSFRLGQSGVGIGTGIGIGWHVYRFLDKTAIPTIENGVFEINSYPDSDRSYKKSKLQSSWVKIPLFIEFQSKNNRRLYASVGVVGGVRIGASAKQVYKTIPGGSSSKPKEKDDFYLNPFRADLEARVGIGPVQLFATYGLTNMFVKDKGPELSQFAVGISFFK